jgi:hypothetical protein
MGLPVCLPGLPPDCFEGLEFSPDSVLLAALSGELPPFCGDLVFSGSFAFELSFWGFEAGGLVSAGRSLSGFESSGFELSGFELSGFELSGFDPSGFALSGFESSGFELAGFERSGFDWADGSWGGRSLLGFGDGAPFFSESGLGGGFSDGFSGLELGARSAEPGFFSAGRISTISSRDRLSPTDGVVGGIAATAVGFVGDGSGRLSRATATNRSRSPARQPCSLGTKFQAR